MIDYIPRGLSNARPRKDIIKHMAQDGFTISDRAFRREIKRLVTEKKELICTTAHGGYYIPLSMAEVEFSLREDNSRISKLIADREAKRAMAREQGL